MAAGASLGALGGFATSLPRCRPETADTVSLLIAADADHSATETPD